jgi:hypothetical protein
MPKYEIDVPGQGKFEVDSPTDLTDAQAYAAVQAQLKPTEPEPTKDTGLMSMTGRALVRGAKQTGSLLGDVLPAMAAKAIGAEEYAAKQMEEAAQTQREIEQKYGARYKTLEDVKGIGDYIPFALETVAEQVPGMATALVPGAGFGVAGGRMAASAAAKKLAEREATEAGARYAAMKTAQGVGRGQIGGTFLGSYALNAPEVFQNIYEETGQMEPAAAVLAGSVSAALDSVLPVAILKQLGPSAKAGVVEKLLERSGMAPGVARKAVGATVGGAATEGLTEGAQEAISITAEKFVQENPELWGSKEFNRIIESSVRGAVGGGVFGVAGAGAGAYLERRRQRQLEVAEETGRSAIDEAREYSTEADTGGGEPGVSLLDQKGLGKGTTDTGTGESLETGLGGTTGSTTDAGVRKKKFDDQLNELRGQQAKIAAFDPNDPRIEEIEEVIKELQAEQKFKSFGAPSQPGFDFGEPPGESTQRRIEGKADEFQLEAPPGYVPDVEGITPIPEGERAKMMLIGTPDSPLKPLTAFFNSLKPSTGNPAQAVAFKDKVRNMLDDVSEFLGFKTSQEVARYVKRDEKGRPIGPPPEPPKGPDVSAPLTGAELNNRLAYLNQFFDSLSIAPKEREVFTSALSQRFAGMDVKSQSEALASLTSAPNLNTVRGINDFSKQLKDALNKYERSRIGIEETVLPFEITEELNKLEPYLAQQIQRALVELDNTQASTRTPEQKAAYAYFGGKNGYPTYSLAMRSAAFDLGVEDTSYSGVIHKDQNKQQAELFRKWVEENLPARELRRFDATVAAYQRMVSRADAAVERADKLKKEGGVARKYIQTISRAPTGKAEGFVFNAGLAQYMPPSKVDTPDPKLFYPIHPAVLARLEANDLNGALKLLTESSVSGAYKTLKGPASDYVKFISNYAKRLLSLNLQTKVDIGNELAYAEKTIDAGAYKAKRTLLNHLQLFEWGEGFIKHYMFDQPLDREEVFRNNLKGLEDLASKRLSFANDAIPPVIGQLNSTLEAYRKAVGNIDAAGVYYYGRGENTISLNPKRGGLSTYVLLHETTHAGTSYALDPDNFNKLSKEQQDAVVELKNLYEYAKNKFEALSESDKQTLREKSSTYGFKDIEEFVSEAFSNENFQEFLRDIKYEGTQKSLWDKFTSFIVKLFGMDNVLGYTLANANIILQAPPATTADLKAFRVRGQSTLKGNRPFNPNFLKTIDKRLMGRPEWSMVKDGMQGFLESVNDTARQYYLGGFTLRQLNDLAGNRIPQFRTFIEKVEGMLDDRNQRLEKVRKIALKWQNWQKDHPELAMLLNKLMIDVTLDDRPAYISKLGARYSINKDPDKGPTYRAEVDAAWKKLDDEGRAIYRQVRDFYKDSLADYVESITENKRAQYRTVGDKIRQKAEYDKETKLLSQSPTDIGRKGTLADTHYNDLLLQDPTGVSAKAYQDALEDISKVKEYFAKHKIDVYFPIRRFGRFSVQFLEGNQKEFYMFESAGQRNRFIAKRKAELEKSLGRKLLDNEVKPRNQIQDLVNENMRDFTFLEELKNIVRSGKGESNEALKNNIEENLEQLYFLTLPDQSVRKMFIRRKGTPGMELDMLRAFTSSAFHMSYQHSRYKFSRGMFDDLATAKEAVTKFKGGREGKIDQEYVAELEKRLKYIMNPTDTGGLPAFLSNASFIWYMTSPASALVNMLGVVAVGMPVVGARYGNTKTAAKMAEMAKKFASAGFRDKEGNVAFPSLNNKDGVLTPLQQRAYDKLVVDGLFDITLSHDIVGMAEAPSNLYTGKSHTAMKWLSGLFHGAEKFNREVVGMSVFDMAYEKAKKDGYADEAAFNKAIEVTKELTYKAMFDYSTLNKPRWFQPAYAKVIFQFKQFAQQMTYLLARSVYEWQRSVLTTAQRKEIQRLDPDDPRLNMYKDIADMIRQDRRQNTPDLPPLTETELDAAVDQFIADVQIEARNRLFGTLGMTAVFAGAGGLPLWWAVAGVANALQSVFGDDEEEWDFENWFKNWCNETFGGFVGDSISRGVASQVLGGDLASRLSLNDMWFRDIRYSPDEVATFKDMVFNFLGPSAGLAINGLEAVKQYNSGHIERAFETGSPAFLKNALKSIRLASEGRATTLKGNELLGDVTGYEAGVQLLGFTPERLAQRQKSNIEMKTIEQKILNRRQALLDAFFMGIDNGDSDLVEETLDKISNFNAANPGAAINGKNLSRSVTSRYKQRALAEANGGMPLNKKLIGQLSELNDYGDPND